MQAARLWESESEAERGGGAPLESGLLVRSADLDELLGFISAERSKYSEQGQPLIYQALGAALSFLRLLNQYSKKLYGVSGDPLPGLGLVWGSVRVLIEVCLVLRQHPLDLIR